MKQKTAIETAIALIILWLIIASTVDRFRNPDLSEIRLFMRLPKAMLFIAPTERQESQGNFPKRQESEEKHHETTRA